MKAFGATAPEPAVMAWLRESIADISMCGYFFYPVDESGYEIAGRFPHVQAWLERVRAIPGWADPYDILPGERILPRW
jgi:glutathione S-transferase